MSNYDGNFIKLGSRLRVGDTIRSGRFEGKHQGRLPVRPNIDHLSLAFKKRFQVLRDYLYSFDDLHWILFFLGLGIGGAGLGYAGYKLGLWKERTMGTKSILKKFKIL